MEGVLLRTKIYRTYLLVVPYGYTVLRGDPD